MKHPFEKTLIAFMRVYQRKHDPKGYIREYLQPTQFQEKCERLTPWFLAFVIIITTVLTLVSL